MKIVVLVNGIEHEAYSHLLKGTEQCRDFQIPVVCIESSIEGLLVFYTDNRAAVGKWYPI